MLNALTSHSPGSAQPGNSPLWVQLHPGWGGAEPASWFYLPAVFPLLSIPMTFTQGHVALPAEAPAHFALTEDNALPLLVSAQDAQRPAGSHTAVPEGWALTCTAHSGVFLSTQKMCDLQGKVKMDLICSPNSNAFTPHQTLI